jgi:hypothetical protein
LFTLEARWKGDKGLEILAWYFGILGGLLTVLFLGTVWYWMRYSRLEKGAAKKAGNLKMVGYGFLVVASWFTCGIVGPPGSALRPEGMRVENAIGSSYAVMLFLFLGFLFVFLGQRMLYKAYGRGDLVS